MIFLDRFQIEEGDNENGRVYVVFDKEIEVLVAYSHSKEEMIVYKEKREYGELHNMPGKELPKK